MDIRPILLVCFFVLTPTFGDIRSNLGNVVRYLLDALSIVPKIHLLYPQSQYNDKNSTHDFIIVGSGPTGSVIINRLSENPEWDVLLLESGEEPSFITDFPFICGPLEFTKYNWAYKTEPQDGFCRGCNEGRMEWPHGNGLGGSSLINYMIFVRGNKLDYDRWAAKGNPGWSFDDVFPYFLKSEDAHIGRSDNNYHRQGGYLTISDIPYRSKVAEAYIKAAQEAGHAYVDYNGAQQLGVSYVQATLRKGRRCSSEKAFLRPIRKRRNVKIQTGSRVVKILINPLTKRAYGVEYIRNGETNFAFANKEVILSAGSLNSPQLLMLSGIGPKEHLQNLGIPVIQNLSVGKTMYDHPTYPGVVFKLNASISIDLIGDILKPATYLEFKQGRGVFTSIGGVEAMTYIRTNVSTDPDPSYPDMELFMVGTSLNTDFGLIYRRIFNIPLKTYDKIWKPLEGKNVYMVLPMLVHPKSKGYMELKSKNPFDAPKFFANYLSDPDNEDVKTFIAAIREIQRINDHPAMQKYGSTLVDTLLPGCEKEIFNSDEYWECCLRTIIGSLYHQVATCKMGPKSDPDAVVDPRLKVYGIKGLRVADTSVIPHTVTAHTVAAAYMIGEKAADIIKEDWKHIIDIRPILLVCFFVLTPTFGDIRSNLGDDLGYLLDALSIIPEIQPLYPQPQYNDENSTHDFIIVGSGPTGSVIMNRLTENPEWDVLLLESGEEPSFITDVPFVCGPLEFTKYNWAYKTEPQDGFCRGCNEGRMEWPHGNALGGSSLINYMIFVRGNKLDYDRWAAKGNPGWSFDDVFPYFLKSEDAHVARSDKNYHRQGGYLTISDIPYRSKVAEAYIKAAQEAGHAYVDYNGARQLGVSYVQATLRKSRRCSSEKAFLRPIRRRKNVKIQTGSRVVKTLIDPKTKRAYGVEYIRNGETHFAFANKEVILSAGSLNSPQLLMLSGIGPKEHLQNLGIPVIQNLSVGKTMYDHPTYPGVVFKLNASISIDLIGDILKPETYLEYKLGRGTLTSIGGVEAMTYIRTNVSTDPDPSFPDMELFMVGISLNADLGLVYRRIFNIPPRIYDTIWRPLEGKNVYMVFPMLVHPKSRGYMELRSKNPFDSPKFFANYLSDPENKDVKTLIAAIREIQRINSNPAMQKYGSTLVDTPLPGCEKEIFNSDEYWECCLRTIIGSLYHQVATCKMGPKSDPDAVVDPRLKVYGIKALRVADTSVIPHTVTAHTAAAAYMIGEKAADIIKEDWKHIV